MQYINLEQQKSALTTDAANRRCTSVTLFKALSLIGAAWLLAFDVWGLETNTDSTITADLEVTGQLTVGSVGDSAGITSIIDDNSGDKLATSAAIETHVDAAIAAVGARYPTEISGQSSAMNFAGARNYCANLNENGGGWRLPTVDELANLCRDTACTADTSLWTATIGTGEKQWVTFIPDGDWASTLYSSSASAATRCIR